MATKHATENAATAPERDTDPVLPGDGIDSDATTSQLAIRHAAENVALGAIGGELTQGDIRLPRLQIAYGVGKMVERGFSPGDLILAKENLIAKRAEPLTIIIMNMLVYFKEYVPFAEIQAGREVRTFMTAAEVLEAGGTLEWRGKVGPTFNKAADVKMLIRKPDALTCGLFGIEIGNALYAPAIWSIDKTAYSRVAPVLVSAAGYALKKRGLLSGKFELKTQIEAVNKNMVPVPAVRLSGYSTDEEIGQIRAMFSGVPDLANTEPAGAFEE